MDNNHENDSGVLPNDAESLEQKHSRAVGERIREIFISIGIPANLKGYYYLREAIKMAVENPDVLNRITKELYPLVGEKFHTTPSRAERAMRHAIEVAWNKGRVEAIKATFGAWVYIGKEKPTNSEFIAIIADKLIHEGF